LKNQILKNQILKKMNFEIRILNFMSSVVRFGDCHLSQFGIEEIWHNWIFILFFVLQGV